MCRSLSELVTMSRGPDGPARAAIHSIAAASFVLGSMLSACGGQTASAAPVPPHHPFAGGPATAPAQAATAPNDAGKTGSAGTASSPTAAVQPTGAGAASTPPTTAVAGAIASAGAAAGSGGAGTPSAAAGGTSGAPVGAAGTLAAGAPDNGPRFATVSDFLGAGPYKAMTIANTGPKNTYTIYRPDMLAPGGAKNPIVGWMSGGSTDPTAYPLLPHLATHGFVVVASNTTPDIGQEVELGQEIIAGISWAIDENKREGSDYFGKLDETKIASMGYSMGALATFTIANDPRLTTTIHISGGNMDSSRIKNLHSPAAFFCGIPGDANCSILDTTCDIAAANCDTDYMNATTSVFYANFPGGHLGILTAPNQDTITTEVTAWLRWKLMLDDSLSARYVGPDCTVCKDTAHWKKVQQKNL
jgi:hypothetical protein